MVNLATYPHLIAPIHLANMECAGLVKEVIRQKCRIPAINIHLDNDVRSWELDRAFLCPQRPGEGRALPKRTIKADVIYVSWQEPDDIYRCSNRVLGPAKHVQIDWSLSTRKSPKDIVRFAIRLYHLTRKIPHMRKIRTVLLLMPSNAMLCSPEVATPSGLDSNTVVNTSSSMQSAVPASYKDDGVPLGLGDVLSTGTQSAQNLPCSPPVAPSPFESPETSLRGRSGCYETSNKHTLLKIAWGDEFTDRVGYLGSGSEGPSKTVTLSAFYEQINFFCWGKNAAALSTQLDLALKVYHRVAPPSDDR